MDGTWAECSERVLAVDRGLGQLPPWKRPSLQSTSLMLHCRFMGEGEWKSAMGSAPREMLSRDGVAGCRGTGS